MKRQLLFKRTRQRGSMLLEAVFGIVIFSLGILALVGLQAASSKQAIASKYRTDAALLANDLVGQMWIDNRAASSLQTNYNSATGGAAYSAWAARVAQTLPGASGSSVPQVTVDNQGIVVVRIFWRAPGEAPSTPIHQYMITTQIVPN